MRDSTREPTPTDTLQELRIFVWGSQPERDDQRTRWNGLSDSEIAATLDAELERHAEVPGKQAAQDALTALAAVAVDAMQRIKPAAEWTGECRHCPARFWSRAELEEHERESHGVRRIKAEDPDETEEPLRRPSAAEPPPIPKP